MGTHLSPKDYSMEKIEIPDGVCYWEPQGNRWHYTTCGELLRREEKDKICRKCKRPIYNWKGAYLC
jgi:hypothetical protein